MMRTTAKRPTVAALICAALVFTSPAHAVQTFLVNSILDGIDDDTSDGLCHTAFNKCTLRAAVMQANRSGGLGATIMLPAGTYVLTRPPNAIDDETGGDLNLTSSPSAGAVITIIGAGAPSSIIDANQMDGAILVESMRTAVITGVTIRGGYTQTFGGGGGIYNGGTLTLERVYVTQNQSVGPGGGIANSSVLTIRDSLFDGNVAASGGGLFNDGVAYITRSTFAFNTANSQGGGIYNNRQLVLVDGTVAGNESLANGGGIYAVENSDAATNIYSSTIAYNDADQDRDSIGSGGGVFISTYLGGTFNIRNTLIAGNTVGNEPVSDDCAGYSSGMLFSYGRNLLGTSAGCSVSTVEGTWNYFSGLLGGLQNNGGPTETVALLSGGYNNAINGGDPTFGCTDQNGNTIPTDQRGYARKVGSACDIGAYEFDPDRIFTNGFD